MNVESLNDKINRLAVRKAEEHVARMEIAVKEASRTAHGTKPGDGTFFGETFRAVLRHWASDNELRTTTSRPKSKEIEDYYRGKILEELLEKLPLVKELSMLQEE